MINNSTTFLECDFARIMKAICYQKYKNGIIEIVQNVITDNKDEYCNNLYDLLYQSSKNTTMMKFSSMIGITDSIINYSTNFIETVTKKWGYYHFKLSLNSYNDDDNNIGYLIKYCRYLVDEVMALYGKAITSTIDGNIFRVSLNINKIAYMDTPYNWIYRYYSTYISRFGTNSLLPIYDHNHGHLSRYLNDVDFPLLYPDEIISTPSLDINMTIFELFKNYGHNKVDMINIDNIWKRWKSYVLWQRKKYIILPLTLLYQNRANLISLYDEDDEIYFYTEIAENLSMISKLDINLQQVICCYL